MVMICLPWILFLQGQPSAPPDAHRLALSRYGTALLKQKRGDLPAAQGLLNSAVALEPGATEPLRALLTVQIALTRYPAAIRTGRAILTRDPEDVRTAMTVGQLLADGNRPIEAKAVLTPYVMKPGEPATQIELLLTLATVNDRLGDRETAEAAHQKRIELFASRAAAIRKANGWAADELAREHGAAWEKLGLLRIAMNKPTAAAEAFFEAEKIFAGPGEHPAGAKRLHLNLARTFANAGDPATAIGHFTTYLKSRPTDTAALIELMTVRFANGQGAEAVRDLEQRLAASPKRTDLAWLLTVARVKAGMIEPNVAVMQFEEWAKAKCDPELMAAAVAVLPESAVFEWFDALVKQANPEPGSGVKKEIRTGPIVRALSDVIRKSPAIAKGFIGRSIADTRAGLSHHPRTSEFAGWLAERAGRLDDAEQAYRGVSNGSWEQARPLVALLERQFKWAEAAEICRNHTTGRGRNIQAMYTLAYCQAELGNVNEALNIVQRLADDERLFAEGKFTVRLQQCRILTAAGHANNAISLAMPLFEMANGPAEIARLRLTLGDAYFASGKVAEGEAQMRAILEDDPDDALALNNLAYNLAEHNRNLADAELFARHALEQDRDDRLRSGDPAPASGTYLDTLGWVLFKRGKLAEARKTLEESLALPDASFNPVVWEHYGDILIKLDEADLAKKAWERALSKYPETNEGKRSGKREAVRKKIQSR